MSEPQVKLIKKPHQIIIEVWWPQNNTWLAVESYSFTDDASEAIAEFESKTALDNLKESSHLRDIYINMAVD
jgi:hypothetical protein